MKKKEERSKKQEVRRSEKSSEDEEETSQCGGCEEIVEQGMIECDVCSRCTMGNSCELITFLQAHIFYENCICLLM